MADVEKPTGTAATEVMGESWPPESETAYFAKANELLSLAAKAQKNAQTTTATATYTGQETDGKAYNAILEQLHLKANAFTVHADEMAKAAGWVKNMGEKIAATKKKIVAEVKAHEANCITGKTIDNMADMLKESQDVATHKGNVTAAMAALETDLTAGETACASDVIGAPPGGTPTIPEDIDPSDAPSDAPATDPTATTTAAGAGTGSSSTSTGGGSSSGSGGSAPAAAALPTEAFAAPAASPAAAPAEAMSGSPASSPAASPADAAGGMPMSGMPMSGMPMQPPQMPAAGGAGQTPGNDLAKTVGDTVTKLAGKDGGTPVSEAALSKLLDAQGDGTGGEGGLGGEKGANGDDPDKLPDGVDPLKKVFGNEGDGGNNGATAQEHGALDPYTSANQNPSLNNPTPPHLASPSPAAPVITPAPSAPLSAPMTELSADDNFVAPQHQQPAALSPESVTTHPSAGPGSPAGPGPAGPGAPGGGPQPGQALGAYNPGAMGSPAPMAPMGPMAPMAPMGGMMPPPAGGGGAAPPVLAAAVPAAAVAEAASSGRRRSPEVPTRLASLPPEHAAAEHHLASLVRVFAQRNWPTAVLAIACVEGQHGVRYLLATADGVSLIPLGVPLPGGVELLSSQPLSDSFTADWSGHVHPARKLAAWASEHSEAGRLVYLVSNDASGVPAVAGKVIEVRQTQAERSGMGGGSPAILPRTSLAADTIPAAKAEAALEAFANAWGISDATADDWRVAPGRLWAARWDRDRPADYPAILATYLYVEGLEAVREGRAADAAFSASALATVRPYDWAAA
ncbi:hypothetical protein [Mycolicibacterium mageritense]|uniref:WXG100-like domain-containing protein n=1 Tax=Mycolicibacterium mageritense TaxID=53462 RepID=UPI0011D3EED0|nr:hypothetical protein [Mycolicibacterium mageritense]TXI65342.1 MAG: hypothetical protein E6Q55_02735 [Mycolicibacterium mageritense]